MQTLIDAFMPLFGIKKIKVDHYYLLCKNTPSGTIYFRCFDKGVADFTVYRNYAWKFTDPEDARAQRIRIGLYPRDLYIEEVRG